MIGCDYKHGTFVGHVWTPIKNDFFNTIRLLYLVLEPKLLKFFNSKG